MAERRVPAWREQAIAVQGLAPCRNFGRRASRSAQPARRGPDKRGRAGSRSNEGVMQSEQSWWKPVFFSVLLSVLLAGCIGTNSDKAKSPDDHRAPANDGGFADGDASAPVYRGNASFVGAPGNSTLRSARYRMQVQLGLSLSPQRSVGKNIVMHGASAVVIEEATP